MTEFNRQNQSDNLDDIEVDIGVEFPPAFLSLVDVLAEQLVEDYLHEEALAGRLPKSYLLPALLPRRTCLYRHFDVTGALLYVGISFEPVARKSGHRLAEWFKSIAWTTEQWFDDRKSAMTAELAAIKTEKPLYNKQGVLRR
jgi:hypothetical protein